MRKNIKALGNGNGVTLSSLSNIIYANSCDKGFNDDETNILYHSELDSKHFDTVRNTFKVQKLALIGSEVTEAIEALREGDEIGHRTELADIIIRVLEYAEHYDIDIEKSILDKLVVNSNRSYKHNKLF